MLHLAGGQNRGKIFKVEQVYKVFRRNLSENKLEESSLTLV